MAQYRPLYSGRYLYSAGARYSAGKFRDTYPHYTGPPTVIATQESLVFCKKLWKGTYCCQPLVVIRKMGRFPTQVWGFPCKDCCCRTFKNCGVFREPRVGSRMFREPGPVTHIHDSKTAPYALTVVACEVAVNSSLVWRVDCRSQQQNMQNIDIVVL